MTSAQTLSVNGVRLNVRVAGEGEPVVLLHGFPDSSALWRKVTPALVAAGHRVIAPDLRGFGESEAPVGVEHYALPQLQRDILGVMDTLGVERAKLVGHDWGAVLGWALAGNHPERFERYCAISVGHPRAYLEGGIAQKLKGWYVLLFQLRGVAETVMRLRDWGPLKLLAGNAEEAEHWVADLARPGRLEASLSIYRANFFPQMRTLSLPDLQMPVLGVWSSGDRFLAEGQMCASARYVKGSFQFERIEGVGHWIPVEAPEALCRILLPFLAGER